MDEAKAQLAVRVPAKLLVKTKQLAIAHPLSLQELVQRLLTLYCKKPSIVDGINGTAGGR